MSAHEHWSLYRHSDQGRGVNGPLKVETKNAVVAEVMIAGYPNDIEEQERRGRLLASAPALLEALELAEATLQRIAPNGDRATQGTRDVIAHAIAKTKGE